MVMTVFRVLAENNIAEYHCGSKEHKGIISRFAS